MWTIFVKAQTSENYRSEPLRRQPAIERETKRRNIGSRLNEKMDLGDLALIEPRSSSTVTETLAVPDR
jgi:hypothetical protein